MLHLQRVKINKVSAEMDRNGMGCDPDNERSHICKNVCTFVIWERK